MKRTINLNRLTTSITISRRLRAITDIPRPPVPSWNDEAIITIVDGKDFGVTIPDPTLIHRTPLFAHQADCCSFLAMVQMVGDGLVTLDRERWN